VTSAARTCWFCDGRLREGEGVTIADLGGVAVHTRCMFELGISAAVPAAAPEAVEDAPDRGHSVA
jgi:hypothetical protein